MNKVTLGEALEKRSEAMAEVAVVVDKEVSKDGKQGKSILYMPGYPPHYIVCRWDDNHKKLQPALVEYNSYDLEHQ